MLGLARRSADGPSSRSGRRCDACDGTGRCAQCGGVPFPEDGYGSLCDVCDGSGRCVECDGRGRPQNWLHDLWEAFDSLDDEERKWFPVLMLFVLGGFGGLAMLFWPYSLPVAVLTVAAFLYTRFRR